MSRSLLTSEAVSRLLATKMTGEHLVTMFETLAAQASESEEPAAMVCVYYLDDADDPAPGQFVPELYFVVHRVENDGLVKDSDSEGD